MLALIIAILVMLMIPTLITGVYFIAFRRQGRKMDRPLAARYWGGTFASIIFITIGTNLITRSTDATNLSGTEELYVILSTLLVGWLIFEGARRGIKIAEAKGHPAYLAYIPILGFLILVMTPEDTVTRITREEETRRRIRAEEED